MALVATGATVWTYQQARDTAIEPLLAVLSKFALAPVPWTREGLETLDAY